jgi:hypothetical protein
MKRLNASILLGACLLASVAMAQAVPQSVKPVKTQVVLGNDEDSFTFVGRCPNGDQYRLVSYQIVVSGISESFYDYEGPAGKGKVSTSASPKTMSVRVCRQLAEIIHQKYWE